MVELNDEQKEFLGMAQAFDRIKMRSNVKQLFGGKDKAVKNIKDLEDKDLITRVSYGIWELTGKGDKFSNFKVGCEDCGRRFDSIDLASQSYSLLCNHENLSYRLDKFDNQTKR